MRKELNKVEKIEPLFLRPVTAAAMLGVSRSRLYEMLNSGAIPAVRLEGRTWRIPKAALDKMAADAMAEHATR
jgi:excisionase family DNA binding protein